MLAAHLKEHDQLIRICKIELWRKSTKEKIMRAFILTGNSVTCQRAGLPRSGKPSTAGSGHLSSCSW